MLSFANLIDDSWWNNWTAIDFQTADRMLIMWSRFSNSNRSHNKYLWLTMGVCFLLNGGYISRKRPTYLFINYLWVLRYVGSNSSRYSINIFTKFHLIYVRLLTFVTFCFCRFFKYREIHQNVCSLKISIFNISLIGWYIYFFGIACGMSQLSNTPRMKS